MTSSHWSLKSDDGPEAPEHDTLDWGEELLGEPDLPLPAEAKPERAVGYAIVGILAVAVVTITAFIALLAS